MSEVVQYGIPAGDEEAEGYMRRFAENIAANFLKHGRPLFSEKAYQVLVDKGEKDRADRYRWTESESILAQTTLKGPGTSTEKSIQLFNEIFGA